MHQVFPLLVKFIDAQDDLSVQVHPDDELAKKLGEPNGKTEMWYVIQADSDAKLNIGFNRPLKRDELRQIVAGNRLESVLRYCNVSAGSCCYIPYLPAWHFRNLPAGVCRCAALYPAGL